MTKASVYIVGTDFSIHDMFRMRGWKVVSSPEEADLIQFTGGEDVSPSLYGQGSHATTRNNSSRDHYESNIFHYYGEKNKVGICRGGQFLNVMSGGKMWQHVNNHAIGGVHDLILTNQAPDIGNKLFKVTSTHHQMMIAGEEGIVWGIANLSTSRESDKEREYGHYDDTEIVFYPHTNSLCFQPHPEYVNIDHECQELYFNLIKNSFDLEVANG